LVRPGFIVYAYRPPNCKAPLKVYWWEAIPALANINWPGVNMDTVMHASTNWYKYLFDSIQFTNVIFNDSKNQTTDLTRSKNGWFVNQQWYDWAPWFATEIETDKTEILFNQLKEKQKINAILKPMHVLDRKLTYLIENSQIASVNDIGEITSKMPGKTVLTIISGDQRISKKIDITVQLSTSVVSEDKELQTLLLYPNPVIDFLTLEYKGLDLPPYSIQIFNINGIMFKNNVDFIKESNGRNELNISSLPQGVYYLKLTNKNQILVRVFIK